MRIIFHTREITIRATITNPMLWDPNIFEAIPDNLDFFLDHYPGATGYFHLAPDDNGNYGWVDVELNDSHDGCPEYPYALLVN